MTAIANTKLEGYTPEEARAIKLQLLEKCMGDSGEKLNRRELFGVLATLKSIPPKAETSTTTTPTTTTPTTSTPPQFDPSKDGKTISLVIDSGMMQCQMLMTLTKRRLGNQ